jgi:hypothetical protein
VVTKKLVGSQTPDLDAFTGYDRRIWICRDPRDFLVSQTLYRWHREEAPDALDEVWFHRVIERMRAKEADPASVPFHELEPADYAATFDAVAELWNRVGGDGWLLYRYEDMVDGRYGPLDDHLGFNVDPEASVAAGLERVARRKGSGDWRSWFTPADVGYYRSGPLDHYMATFGYDRSDWDLDPTPELDPRHGSAYMWSLYHDHRLDAGDAVEAGDAGDAVDPSDERSGVLARLVARLR